MLFDNSTPQTSVAKWIEEQTKTGSFDATSGYFTVGILSHLSKLLNDKISKFRFILGDIVCNDLDKDNPINLLTETITVDAALKLNSVAREAVSFLQQDNVKVHTVEPNFCHAKTLLFRAPSQPNSYYVTGSSNLTEAGLGMKPTSNIELNILGQGTAPDFEGICNWFDKLWENPKTQSFKTVEGKKIPFKNYLIGEIEKIFLLYSPRELYFKTLFELFRDQLIELENNNELQQRIGHLKHTKIYQTLYEFQQKGVLSLIKKLEDYNGAILADAVGLGKTWSALAVIKYYEYKGYRPILLCPKKLATNWQRYRKNKDSIFESDKLDYVIRYHTDLQDDRLETNHSDGLTLEDFQSDTPKLFVIDESHNLRNHRSRRYKMLMEELLQKNKNVKVLLLSATPINNDFRDLRNQFSLMVKGDDNGFAEAKGIEVDNLTNKFSSASKAFNAWSEDPERNVATLLKDLPEEIIRLMDRLIVARTRTHIKGLSQTFSFPDMRPPQNEYLDSLNIEDLDSFEDILDKLPKYFAAYKPAFYAGLENATDVLKDEAKRDQFLVVMLNKLLVKRLESSWSAFHRTLKKVRSVHTSVLYAVDHYESSETCSYDLGLGLDFEEELSFFNTEGLNLTIGKRAIKLSDIEKAGNLEDFREHLRDDIAHLDFLINILDKYATRVDSETSHASDDHKLQRLMALLNEQLADDKPSDSRRLLVFTSYKDTANYLFEELKDRGYGKMVCISGDGARTSQAPDVLETKIEPFLERFCPFTKLFMERDWKDLPFKKEANWNSFHQWKDWVKKQNGKVASQLDYPIEIIIATDCLSEGQNLQDCDTIINYDIHWNPVRLIQRLGRIDRIGSPNDTVRGINFWPSPTLDDYLNLQGRVENRAVAIATAGSEVPSITEDVRKRLQDDDFQCNQEAKMLKHLESSWEELEEDAQALSFADLSLEYFRQDLLKELSEKQQYYDSLPLGIYTGFKNTTSTQQSGLIALLGYPSRQNGHPTPYQRHNLVFIDPQGNTIYDKVGDVLKLLADHQSAERYVPDQIDKNDPATIEKLSTSLKAWMESFSSNDGLDDLLLGLQGGDPQALNQASSNDTLEDQYDPENCDLILWFHISK